MISIPSRVLIILFFFLVQVVVGEGDGELVTKQEV